MLIRKKVIVSPEIHNTYQLLQRVWDEGGILTSEVEDGFYKPQLREGFFITIGWEDQDGDQPERLWFALAYSFKNGREFKLKTDYHKNRDDAEREIFRYIRSINKALKCN